MGVQSAPSIKRHLSKNCYLNRKFVFLLNNVIGSTETGEFADDSYFTAGNLICLWADWFI